MHGSHDEKLGKTASATHPDIPRVKHLPNQNLFKEAKFIYPFVSCPRETKHPSPPSLEPKTYPSSHQNVVLDSGRDSTFDLHHISSMNENSCAMNMPKAPTLETKQEFANKHWNFSFEIPLDSCSLFESPELIVPSATCFYEDHNHLLILVIKIFKRMVECFCLPQTLQIP